MAVNARSDKGRYGFTLTGAPLAHLKELAAADGVTEAAELHKLIHEEHERRALGVSGIQVLRPAAGGDPAPAFLFTDLWFSRLPVADSRS